ncbi:AraC family transcriptional regulator (plasmid) [Azospirillum humicireducens]|uniref:AraC family transcriptional regulator n=1 Tax=Azospirillum humicireducens TaxID=1226968 RepID=A0A2R4VQ82_9PROT|nr:AraC family transcriptional regulator [Azospirillum humicireducens]AWB06603.1 AraC family transcriptional regulator [Azospirillum humicireducens]
MDMIAADMPAAPSSFNAPSFNASALRLCRIFETSDLDDARERISKVMQPHSLMACGRPQGHQTSHMDFMAMKGMGIGTIKFGQASIAVPPLDDYYLAILCVSGGAEIRIERDTFTVDRFNGVLCSPGSPIAGQFSPDCEQLVLKIARTRLAAFNGPRPVRLAARLDLRSPRLTPLLVALRGVIGDPATVRLIRNDPVVAAEYEQLFLRLLLAGQDCAETDDRPQGPRPVSVHRAIAYLRENSTAAITLADIAQAAGVPERTLHDAFKRFEGVSPLRYLRNLRLDDVHAQLRSGGGEDASVTVIALNAGFTHLSRFAQDYAERFGERPSDTLRRGCA